MDTTYNNDIRRAARILTALDAASGDTFGSAVAVSGNGLVMAVGARLWEGTSTNQGGVYIYDWMDGRWEERGSVLVASPVVGSGQFGRSLALNEDGSVLAVGSPVAGTGGTVYILDWNGSAWTQRGTVIPADVAAADNFGISVALSQDGLVLAVGAALWEGGSTNQGGVYIFDWNSGGSTWDQRGSVLVASDATNDDWFGYAVAMNADATVLAVTGRQWEGSISDQGGVYIFDWNSGSSTYVQRGSVIGAGDAASFDYFGSSLAMSADGLLLLIGVPNWEGSLSDQGGVYFYKWHSGLSSWVSFGPGTLQAHDPGSSYLFGSGVAMSADGTRIVIGSEGWARPTSTQGGVYTYDFFRYLLANWNGTEDDLVLDDAGLPAERQFVVHEQATGRLVGAAMSDVDGYLEIGVATSAPCYIVGFDDEAGLDYNAKIYSNVTPILL
jgi:hypothetical protein